MDELVGSKPSPQNFTVGEFHLDRAKIRIWRGNRPLQLSIRQFQMLDYFMQHAGKTVSLRDLKDLVWGPDADVQDPSVTIEIARLRRAIGGRRREQPIRTVRKSGYVFEIPKRRVSGKRERSTFDDESRPRAWR